MLDVGSNTGILGLLAIHEGCEALFFDLQPSCNGFVNGALVVNNYQAHGRVFNTAVSDTEGVLTVAVNSVCDGKKQVATAHVHTESADKQGAKSHATQEVKRETREVRMLPLRHVLPNEEGVEVLMMKVDTEGNEHRVLRGAMEFFEHHRILNAIVEVTPCCNFWTNANITREQVADTFKTVSGFGYHMKPLWKRDELVRTTPQQVFDFVMLEKFDQVDLWLFLP
jgi:FkbM family methyltransferase